MLLLLYEVKWIFFERELALFGRVQLLDLSKKIAKNYRKNWIDLSAKMLSVKSEYNINLKAISTRYSYNFRGGKTLL